MALIRDVRRHRLRRDLASGVCVSRRSGHQVKADLNTTARRNEGR